MAAAASDDEDAELGLRLADAEPSADGVGFKAIVGELLRDAEGTPGTAERTGKITTGQVLVALDGESLLGRVGLSLGRAALNALLLKTPWYVMPANSEKDALKIIQACCRACDEKALLGLKRARPS